MSSPDLTCNPQAAKPKAKPPLTCKRCGSDQLTIRQREGFELIISFFTSRRKYRCVICDYKFRARDRRQTPREAGDAYEAARSAGILR